MQVIDLSNLLKDNTFIMKYWDYKKNMNNDLDKLTIGSNKKVWWICDKGHSYDQVIRSKVKGIGCPICSNKKVLKGYNDLATTNPELLKEWNYDKNVKLGLNPELVTKGAEKKFGGFVQHVRKHMSVCYIPKRRMLDVPIAVIKL